MQNSKGLTSIVILFVGIVILVVTFVLYNSPRSEIDYSNFVNTEIQSRKTSEDTIPQIKDEISDFDDEETLKSELDATVVGNPEADFSDLEQEALSL